MSRFKEYLNEEKELDEVEIFKVLKKTLEDVNFKSVDFSNISMKNGKLCFDARTAIGQPGILHSFEIDIVKKH